MPRSRPLVSSFGELGDVPAARSVYNARMKRRDFLATVAATGAVATSPRLLAAQTSNKVQRKGRLKQALFRQVFGQTTMSFDDQCRIAADLGCAGFDLVGAQ